MHIGTKKYSLLAASVLLVVAAACGSDNKASDATTAAPAATTAGTAAPAATTAGTDAPATSAATAGTAGAATGAAPAGMKVVYVPGLTGNPFYNTVACGAQKKADELGIDFTYQGAPEFDVAKQSAIVSALVGEKPDAIMKVLRSAGLHSVTYVCKIRKCKARVGVQRVDAVFVYDVHGMGRHGTSRPQ